jgi:hypothetical protein
MGLLHTLKAGDSNPIRFVFIRVILFIIDLIFNSFELRTFVRNEMPKSPRETVYTHPSAKIGGIRKNDTRPKRTTTTTTTQHK